VIISQFFYRSGALPVAEAIVKFCMHCTLAYYTDMSSPLLVNFGLRGVTGRRYYFQDDCLCQILCVGMAWESELGTAALRKAIWWDFRLASRLMHVLSFLPPVL